MRYIIYMNGNRICPKCNAMMVRMVRFGGDVMYRCLDCNTRYNIIDLGLMDKEMVLEEIKPLKLQE